MLSGKKIVIAGGSGFIGQAMATRWSGQNEVIILSRGSHAANNSYGAVQIPQIAVVMPWDGKHPGDWVTCLENTDLLINLSGRSVNCRYNDDNKTAIFSSRLDSTRALRAAVLTCSHPPALWINAASATIYPLACDTPRNESYTAFEDDFSVQVCKAWEQAFSELVLPQTRKITLRMAIVLGHGGALLPFTRLVRCFLGGPQGSGRQKFSWIHIDDLCGIIEWMEANDGASGIYNAAAPHPVSNHVFMQAIREILHIPFGLPTPEWLLKLGAKIIGTETELLLKSRWVLPGRLLKEGFRFTYPAIRQALTHLLVKGDNFAAI